MQRILYLLLLAGYLMVACRTGKKEAPATGGVPAGGVPTEGVPAGHALTFGSGGGFTGAVTTYTLHPDGQLYRTKTFNATTGPELIGKLDRELTAGFFKKAADLLGRTPAFHHPDNQYYFVKLGAGEAQPSITWGSPEHPAPAGVEAFYQELMQHTQVTR
ncbi:MAG: hypothetical protein AVDCRST_MAG56-2516 [uncultured Cytophagales bacterium]|uniref:Uncharacterized protein n=1 Tax=uncultured Cytophagales bacterium TaxID=158755 RepID=A0A6J4ISB0_9SPHI|nr:MAG: hypothetical protein AVDCRST_MAG56-2516 [uncultured Cytophagales bacterium]